MVSAGWQQAHLRSACRLWLPLHTCCWGRRPSQAGPWVAHRHRVRPHAGAPLASSLEAGGAGTGAWVGVGVGATARSPGTAVSWVDICQRKAGPTTGQQLGQTGAGGARRELCVPQSGQEGPRSGSGARERVSSDQRGRLLEERGPRVYSAGSLVLSAETGWRRQRPVCRRGRGRGPHGVGGGLAWPVEGMGAGCQASRPQDWLRLWLEGLCSHVGTMSAVTLDLEHTPCVWHLKLWRLGFWAGLPGVMGGPQVTAGDGARRQYPKRKGE